MLVTVLLGFCLVIFSLLSLLSLCLYVALHRAPSTTRRSSLGRSAAVVVLGDVGRSPRMCYHVESLANEGWRVAVVGYKGTTPPPALRRKSIRHHHLPQPPNFIARLPRAAFAIVAPLKVLQQSGALFWHLCAHVQPPPEVLLVQTPPALPTLFVVKVAAALLGSRVIIDWHNLGFTILALRMGPSHKLVRLAKFLERLSGRSAFAHLFVTRAMLQHLDSSWGLKGRKVVLHDRPPEHFKRSSNAEVHALMGRLCKALAPDLDDWFPAYSWPSSTPFTFVGPQTPSVGSAQQYQSQQKKMSAEAGLDSPSPSATLRPDSPAPSTPRWTQGGWSGGNGSASNSVEQLRDDRPALVVSSTSWTADEDFSVLLKAATIYERRARDLARGGPASARSPIDGSWPSNASSPRASSPTPPLVLDTTAANSVVAAPAQPTTPIEGSVRDKSRRASMIARESLPNEPARSLPRLLIIVTGKGEQKAFYEREIERLEREEKWEWVRIRTAWLESRDYPVLLGAADVGVSLHTSSSGLDLPMKVVDMLGCGLPVCALDFACLDELVEHKCNGLVFRDAEGLARQFESLLAQHPSPSWLATHLATLPTAFDTSSVVGPAGQALQRKGSSASINSSASSSVANGAASPTSPIGSPLPMFTTTCSPMRRAQSLSATSSSGGGGGGGIGGSGQVLQGVSRGLGATWSSNWRSVVRPLLSAADEEDEMLSASSSMASLARQQHSKSLTADSIGGVVVSGGANRASLEVNTDPYGAAAWKHSRHSSAPGRSGVAANGSSVGAATSTTPINEGFGMLRGFVGLGFGSGSRTQYSSPNSSLGEEEEAQALMRGDGRARTTGEAWDEDEDVVAGGDEGKGASYASSRGQNVRLRHRRSVKRRDGQRNGEGAVMGVDDGRSRGETKRGESQSDNIPDIHISAPG